MAEDRSNAQDKPFAAAAMELLVELAVPRLSGSAAEQRVLNFIEEKLCACGLSVRKQAVSFWPFFQWVAVKGLLAALIAVLLTLWVLAPRHPLLAGALAPLPLLLLGLIMVSQKRLEARVCELDPAQEHPMLSALFPAAAARFDTCNLLVDLSGPGAADWSPHLVLMAHVDTKSQNISIVARIVSVAGGLLLTLLFCLLLALAALFPTLAESSLLRLISSALLIADIGLALALLGLSVHNESPGALDNGGSCAVLLQTAAVLAERPELAAGVRVSFAFTGGEELGLAGSRALVGRARELLGPPERLLVLNLDGVGAPGDAVLTSETGLIPRGRSAELMRLVAAAAERRGLRLRLLKTVVGGEADHIPFQEAGVQAVSLAHFSSHTLAVHTAQDTLDKVDPQRLAQAHELILAVLEQLRPPAPAAKGAEGACSTLTMSPKA